MKSGISCAVSALAFAVATASPTGAAAQTTASATDDETIEVGEIIVTARRRDERLADVPLAAAVLDAASLEARGSPTSVLDLLSGQAGLRFFNSSSPNTSEISLRGSPTARATTSDPSVGLYRNGAYIGGGAVAGRTFQRIDLFDIGRVEVLRGTQGALYGRNAVGGAVNIISAPAAYENSGYIDLRYGIENKSPQIQAVGNVDLGGGFAARVGVDAISQDDGFFYNPTNDVYFDQQKSIGLRGQLRWRNDSTDVSVLAEHFDGHVPGITFRVVIAPTPGVFPFGVTQDERSYPHSLPPLATQNIENYVLSVDHDFGGAKLTSTTLYRSRESFYQFDADGTNPVTLAADRAAGRVLIPIDAGAGSLIADDTRIINQDVHLAGSLLDDRLDWLVGGEYLTLVSKSSTTVLRTPTVPNPSTGTFSPVRLEYDSWAIYGSLNYNLTSTFALSGEARYTKDKRSISARRFDLRTGLPSGGNQFIIDSETSPDNVSYNAVIAWKTPLKMLAYAKVGSSYRAGGFNSNLGDPRAPVPVIVAYGEESSKVYEIGLKGQVDPQLYLAFAAYRTDADDLIVQTDNGCNIALPACPVLATSFLTNAGKAETTGFEAEATGRLQIGGGTFLLTLSGSHQNGKIVAGPFRGRDIPQVPDWIAGVNANYRVPVSDSTSIFFNVSYSGQWGGIQELIRPGLAPEPLNFPVEDITQIDLRVGARIGQTDLTFFVTNLTDERYSIFTTTTTQRLNQPRNFGVQLRQRF